MTAVYTCVLGAYDNLRGAPRVDGVDFIAFTDEDVPPGWREVRIGGALDPRRASRRPKVLSCSHLPGHDVTIWIDGCYMVGPGFDHRPLVDMLDGADLAVMPHPDRDCLYQEASCCVSYSLDSAEVVMAQASRYMKEGFPTRAGLYDCSIIVRKKCEAVGFFERLWMSEIDGGSCRDQISFPYAVAKSGVTVSAMSPELVRGLKRMPHTVRRPIPVL